MKKILIKGNRRCAGRLPWRLVAWLYNASEATKDGSGAAGISGRSSIRGSGGSQFAGEEWYDQRATFQVNREKAHTSFYLFPDGRGCKGT